jgi:tRNA splicing ligase
MYFKSTIKDKKVDYIVDKSIENEFNQFCDKYFTSDSQIEQYCKDKFIPYDNEEFNE